MQGTTHKSLSLNIYFGEAQGPTIKQNLGGKRLLGGTLRVFADAMNTISKMPMYLFGSDAQTSLQRTYGKNEDPLFPNVITAVERDRLWKRNGTLRRIIKKPNEDCFNKYFKVTSREKKKFEKEVEKLCKKLRISSVLKKAGIFASKDGYCLILKGYGDAGNWDAPPKDPHDLKYLKVIPSKFVEKYKMSKHPTEGDMQGVEFWYIKGFKGKNESIPVHHSRVIHVMMEMDEVDSPKGVSVIEILYNILFVLENEIWAFGQNAYRVGGGFPVFKVSDMDNPVVKQLEEDYPTWHAKRGLIADENIIKDVQFVGSAGVALHPPEYMGPMIDLLCEECGIPKPVLMGTEAGAVTGSEYNFRSYATEIKAIQKNFWEPMIRDLLDELMDYGLISSVKDYTVEWEDIIEEDEREKAEILKLKAEAGEKLTTFLTLDEVRKTFDPELPELDEETNKQILGLLKLQQKKSLEEYTSSPSLE